MWGDTQAHGKWETEGNGRDVTYMNMHMNEIKHTNIYIPED